MSHPLMRVFVFAFLVPLLACGRGDPRDQADAGRGDTVADVRPRSPGEIEQRAVPMTPERARELGVVDTTIKVSEEP
ncbi:MAG: hypothetical protein H0X65_10695 [Gemmatimonadetes bacterium]|nr:hypothetical protein [Gemmatimonadota bacterium]